MADGKDQKCLAAYYEELNAKYILLQREWQCKQETLGQLLTEETELQSALRRQAEFCSEVGSTFGVFLGEATRSPEFIDTIWRQQDKIEDLLQVIIGGLTSFNNTYHSYTTIAKTHETRFIQSIFKMVANLSTTNDGQRYFSTTNSGNTIIKLIIKIVHRLPSPSGNALKKLAYTALHNVSLNSLVSSMIIVPELIVALNEDINDASAAPELTTIALKLIHSLLQNACTNNTYYNMNNNIKKCRLIKLACSTDADTKKIAKKILDDFQKASKHFK